MSQLTQVITEKTLAYEQARKDSLARRAEEEARTQREADKLRAVVNILREATQELADKGITLGMDEKYAGDNWPELHILLRRQATKRGAVIISPAVTGEKVEIRVDDLDYVVSKSGADFKAETPILAAEYGLKLALQSYYDKLLEAEF